MLAVALQDPCWQRPFMTDETLVAPDDDAEAKLLGQALKNLRTRAGLSQAVAAEAMGFTSGEAWRVYEAGTASGIFKPGLQFRLASAVGATLSQMLAERDRLAGKVSAISPARADPFNGGARTGLRIRDRVQAGAWLAADDTIQTFPRTYPATLDGRYPQADQWLSEIVGDSMNRLAIYDGDFVHCVDAEAINYQPRNTDIVEVERLRVGGAERELTVKQIEITPAGILLCPRSTNPRWSEPLRLDDQIAEGEEYEVRIRALVVGSMRRY